MRIAVSGATGLIGRAVVAALGRSHEIVTVGRHADAALQADFNDVGSVERLDLRGIEGFVHCAGIVDEDFRRDRAAAWVKGTAAITALAARVQAARMRVFVYLSSAHVYGPLTGSIDESTLPDPRSDYAIAHYAAEQIVRRTARSDLKGIVLRPCAVYGEPLLDRFDRWSLIPFSFPLEAVQHQTITLKSSGEQRRNFVDAADVAEEIALRLLRLDELQPWQVTNPVGSDTMSVYDFARLCGEVYEAVSGRRCVIVRPDPLSAALDAPLEYRSTNAYHRASRRIADFVHQFTETLIRKERNVPRNQT